jgi:hypothetical protein
VQKIKQFARLPRLSATRKGLCIAASFLFLAAAVRAGEPAMTLAMNEPSANSSASSLNLVPDSNGSNLNLPNTQPEAASPVAEKEVVSGGQIENQTDLGERESSQLVRENSHSEKPVSITAGYGRIWDDQSTLQKIAVGHQEPGCAYVSAKFSF